MLNGSQHRLSRKTFFDIGRNNEMLIHDRNVLPKRIPHQGLHCFECHQLKPEALTLCLSNKFFCYIRSEIRPYALTFRRCVSTNVWTTTSHGSMRVCEWCFATFRRRFNVQKIEILKMFSSGCMWDQVMRRQVTQWTKHAIVVARIVFIGNKYCCQFPIGWCKLDFQQSADLKWQSNFSIINKRNSIF